MPENHKIKTVSEFMKLCGGVGNDDLQLANKLYDKVRAMEVGDMLIHATPKDAAKAIMRSVIFPTLKQWFN